MILIFAFLLYRGCVKLSSKNAMIKNLSSLVQNSDVQIKEYSDKYGKLHYQFESVKMEKELLRIAYSNRIDSISKLIKIKASNVQAVTQVTSETKHELKPEVITIIDTFNGERRFKFKDGDEWFAIVGGGYIDSVGRVNRLNLSYNSKDSLYITEFTKKSLFKPSKTIIDIYNSNPHNSISGVSKIEVKEKKRRFGIGVQVGYGISNTFTPSLYVGVGGQYSLICF